MTVSPEQNTGQRCSNCGVVEAHNRDKANRKAVLCVLCEYSGDEDVNAAGNILARAFGGWEEPAMPIPAAAIEAA